MHSLPRIRDISVQKSLKGDTTPLLAIYWTDGSQQYLETELGSQLLGTIAEAVNTKLGLLEADHAK